MKRTLFIIFLVYAMPVHGQLVQLLPEFGIGLTSPIAFDRNADYYNVLSPHGSILAGVHVSRSLWAQSGVWVNRFDVQVREDNDRITGSMTIVQPVFMRMPLQIVYVKDIKKISLQVYGGPYVGVGVSGSYERITRDVQIDPEAIVFDKRRISWSHGQNGSDRIHYGFDIGARLHFHRGFFINTAYSRSFHALSFEGIRTTPYIRSFIIGLGYCWKVVK